jgi:hypothetical protein
MNRILPLLASLLLLGILPLWAQPPDMPPGDRRPSERIEHFRKVRLIEMLDLKEEQSVRFFARLNEHESTKRAIMKEKMDLLDKLERLVRNHAEEKDYEKLFPDIAAINDRVVLEDKKFFLGLSDILSAEQRSKFLLFERQFDRELRDAMRDMWDKRRTRMGRE